MISLRALIYVASSSVLFSLAILPSVSAKPISVSNDLVTNASAPTKNESRLNSSEATKVSTDLPVTSLKVADSKSLSSTPEVLNQIDSLKLAEPKTNENNLNPVSQVTSVSNLSDVKATDWAFTALQSLVERYGCIAGYPDRTYRGKQSISRYEFAAGLNACADKINEIVSSGLADKVGKEDLSTLSKLQQEFATELATLRGRVDALDAKTTKLEEQQFSTTTKLGGEAIFGLSTAWGGKAPGLGQTNTVLTHLTRIGTVTSFTGKDRLRLELSSGNFAEGGFTNAKSLNTNTAILSFQSNTLNQFVLSRLDYRFPVFNDRMVVSVQPVGFSLSNVLSANSPYFDSGRGSISRFGEASPIFKIGNLNAGAGFDWLISDRVRLQYAYGVNNASAPGEDGGISGSRQQAMGLQLLLLPSSNVITGLTYVRGYSRDGRLNTFTGSAVADASNFILTPATIDAFNGSLQWRISPKLTFSTWGGLMQANSTGSSVAKSATSTTFLFALGLTDIFNEGDLLALLFGQPPKLVSSSEPILDTTPSYHAELFYRFNVSRNISITPGIFMVTNPGNVAGNNTIYVGTIRTTLRF